MSIKDNLNVITAKIKECENNSSYNEQVKLLAVTKYRPKEDLMEVYDYGIRDFGENRVKEFVDKYEFFKDYDINWHFIGHLQRNKVKDIIGKTYLIHSVDSVRLAKEINKQSAKKDVVTDILIEFNIGEEENKDGLPKESYKEVFDELVLLNNINVKGLMCMAPNTEDKSVLDEVFSNLRKLYENCRKLYCKYDNINLEVVSMGMSNDYPIAIAHGSNIVRIGTSIFKGDDNDGI